MLRTLLLTILLSAVWAHAGEPAKADPLVIGETFTLASKALGETRRINVYRPPGDAGAKGAALPVLYLLDGGAQEDFLHIAGLVQVSVANGTMRPFLLIGIENTERRRDFTGPTQVADDRKIAPRVGGSAAFRTFLRDELMPEVAARYRVTGERAVIGESLAGLFIVETLLSEPDLFATYIAIDPSLWWNGGALVRNAARPVRAKPTLRATLFLAASSDGNAGVVEDFVANLRATSPAGLELIYEKMPDERHLTIFHPAALKALRAVCGAEG